MNSSLLTTIHIISVNLFVLIYLIKTILLFSSINKLEKFIGMTRILEMLISTIFLITGIWLLFIAGAIKTLFIIKFILVFASIPVAIIGFRRRNKLMAVLSLLMTVSAYGLSEAARKKTYMASKVEVSGNADEAAKLGIKTYIANCAMCHGKDGRKMYRDSYDLSASSLDQASIELLVREGSKVKRSMGQTSMPAFAGTLSDEEISAVSSYVLTLRK